MFPACLQQYSEFMVLPVFSWVGRRRQAGSRSTTPMVSRCGHNVNNRIAFSTARCGASQSVQFAPRRVVQHHQEATGSSRCWPIWSVLYGHNLVSTTRCGGTNGRLCGRLNVSSPTNRILRYKLARRSVGW